MSVLRVRDLAVDLGGRAVLRDIAFDAPAGKIIGLIGPNGAGKTTLLRAISQLTPSRSGSVEWDGYAVDRMDARTRATRLAYLPQGQTLHWPLSVRRLVELGRLPMLGPLSRLSKADADAVDAAMESTGVDHLAERDTLSLSGGERARVLLARALAVDAPVLLADEPTASLDPYHVLEIMTLLRRSAREGRLVITVTHELSLVSRFCDEVVLIDKGRKVADGTPSAVLSPERLREVYRIEPAASAGLGQFQTV
jgi:iron complex transport system ATP-binding protein